MKTRSLTFVTLAFGLTLALPTLAQETMKYDPIMEKRADLRLKWIRAQREAAETSRLQRQSTGRSTQVSTINRPDLVNFTALIGKRADLRLQAIRVGIEAACDAYKAQQ